MKLISWSINNQQLLTFHQLVLFVSSLVYGKIYKKHILSEYKPKSLISVQLNQYGYEIFLLSQITKKKCIHKGHLEYTEKKSLILKMRF